MFNAGDQVVQVGIRGTVGTVISGPNRHGGENYYRVNFSGSVKNVLEEYLSLHDGDQDPESLLLSGAFGDHVAFARRLTQSKLRDPLRDAVYSYKAARTEFHPYQFKPLLRFLASPRRRLLIADEVGLGKTIEAGYILQEERARTDVRRVLIVCPAALRNKWQQELGRRFGEEFEILDRATFQRKVLMKALTEEEALPRLSGIVSLQSLRDANLITELEAGAGPLDMLIVDEAHHCRNPDTKQHRAVRALGEASEAAILLTATPIHLGTENLFHLLQLILPEEFDRLSAFQDRMEVNRHIVDAETSVRRGASGWTESALEHLTSVELTFQAERFQQNPLYVETVSMLRSGGVPDRNQTILIQDNLSQLNLLTSVMTRTRKRDVYPDAAKRTAHVLSVEMSEAERTAYTRLSEFCFSQYAAANGDQTSQFAVVNLQRQFASSLYATLEHYIELFGIASESVEPADELDVDFGDEEAEPQERQGRGSAERIDQDGRFQSLLRECRNMLGTVDSKFQRLLVLLREHPKAVIFSYYKRSLRYLERELLNAGIGCVRIDGDVPMDHHNPEKDERGTRIATFRGDPKVRVLLSSEVGSEGLDFQFCSVLVNWDLPWNPMVVEQRIGRLDRLGQKAERILIFSFACPGTIEDVILERLYQRIGVFERSIGILEPILGQEIRELTAALFSTALTEAEREAMIEGRARVLAQRARDEERLEMEASSLVGQDEYFNEQFGRMRRLGRFVTGDELRIFLSEFLRAKFPKCTFLDLDESEIDLTTPDHERVFCCRVTGSLLDFCRGPLPVNDPGMARFADACRTGRVALTFDGAVALRNPRVELINASHPLIRAIGNFYASNPTHLHPVSSLKVCSNLVAEGEYMFLWASVEETGARPGRSLWSVLINAGDDTCVEPETAECLMHEMLLAGERWDDFDCPLPEFTKRLWNLAHEVIADRSKEYRVAAERQSTIVVEQRLASLEASYRVKRSERERRRLENEIRGNRRVVPLFEAQLRKLDAEHGENCRRLEERRKCSVNWTIEGGGYVCVVHPES